MDATTSLRVCLVEDDADTLESSSKLLRVLGHQTLAANSGQLALAQAPAWKPDVMLIDLAMPSLDGCELARQLRSQTDFNLVPLVAVSGYVDAKHRQQAADAGFDEFLGKPYSLDDLQGLFARLETRIIATRSMAEKTRAVSEATRLLYERSRAGLKRSEP